MKSALILGITGQDGSYLAELLLARDYNVHGLVRRASMFNRARIEPLRAAHGADGRLTLHYGELGDATSFRRLLAAVRPDEIYHLAGQSHVGLSFEIPEVTCQENGMAVLQILESLRDFGRPIRFYHAASSEIFGAAREAPQNEDTALNPVNPYGCAKAFATQLVRVYRQAYGLWTCNGIAYNHESPRRGENFVTRKTTLAAARWKAGAKVPLRLGNLGARRDWGFAPEYVEAMWRALQHESGGDYVLATGRTCSVREFAAAAFAAAGIEIVFEGEGAAEVARRRDSGELVIEVDPRYQRAIDPAVLVGDATRADKVLEWRAKTAGADVARAMVEAELTAISAKW